MYVCVLCVHTGMDVFVFEAGNYCGLNPPLGLFSNEAHMLH